MNMGIFTKYSSHGPALRTTRQKIILATRARKNCTLHPCFEKPSLLTADISLNPISAQTSKLPPTPRPSQQQEQQKSKHTPVGIRTVPRDDHLEPRQPANGHSVAARGELQQPPLALGRQRVRDLPEIPHGLALGRVAVVLRRGLELGEVEDLAAADELLDLLGSEQQGQRALVRDHLEAAPERLELPLDRLVQQEVRVEVDELALVVLRHVDLVALVLQVVEQQGAEHVSARGIRLSIRMARCTEKISGIDPSVAWWRSGKGRNWR